MEEPGPQWDKWREKIIGLGELSGRKNYYPELQKRVDELKASESELLTLFNSVTDAIIIHDFNGIIADVNDSMLAMYQVTREQAVGLSIYHFSAPGQEEERGVELYQELYDKSAKQLLEWKARRPHNDTLFDVEVGIQAVQWKKKPMIVAVVRDITPRKQLEAKRRELEAQLAQVQKMESIGRLAGGVAHDFNNMLQAILGNATLALEEAPPGSLIREFLEEIQSSAQRSADLTRQLLAFARKQTIAPKQLDLNDVVASMLKMLQRLIGENIELIWIPGANLWPVKMDTSQIDQILANLCVNARDAIAGTGKITLQTENVVLDDTYVQIRPDYMPGDYVQLIVSDTGKGMDAATRSHLFEPFFTTKEVGKGTGLGLATVFGIVKQNRGLISVYSEPDKGATFKILLPRAEFQLTASEQKGASRSLRGTETVLLVEDEEQVLNLGRRILSQQGYTVLTAPTPAQALSVAREFAGAIHLLATDVIMPGMNGKELRDRIRADRPEIRCLFMSGYTDDVIAHQGMIETGVSFLQKPFTNRSLGEKVREVLEQPQTAMQSTGTTML